MNKILYFHNGRSSFVDKDLIILKSKYEVKEFFFDVSNKINVPFFLLKQFFFLIANLFVNKYVIQFGGYHSVIPVLFSKIFKKNKSIIILGGTDCVSFPSIQYGNFFKKGLKIATTISLKNANLLLPVDETLVKYKYDYQTNDFPYQGYKYFIKDIKTPYKVIYNGYNFDKWKNETKKEKNSFVTVGANLGSRFGFSLKGIDLIFEIAPFFPTCKFYIVGGTSIKNKTIPNNIILTPNIPNNELIDFIGSKEFYLQLSMSEGFPNALCEAMLLECIPIVSAVGAMPMIVESKKYILQNKSITELESIINNLLLSEIDLEEIRNRIKNNLSLERRKKQLFESLN